MKDTPASALYIPAYASYYLTPSTPLCVPPVLALLPHSLQNRTRPLDDMEAEITVAPSVRQQCYNLSDTNKPDIEPPFRLDPDDVPGNKFAFSSAQLHQLCSARTTNALRAFGGLPGLSAGIRTDLREGLVSEEDLLDGTVTLADALRGSNVPKSSSNPASSTPGRFTDRRNAYGENRIPKKKPKTLLQLIWDAFNDKLMFLLTASATVSLALGIYQSVASKEEGARIEWVEGVAILIAVVVIVLATAINDYQKNYKFQKLNEKKEERMVTVTRSGEHCCISVFDVVVGDLLHVETGDIAPADGILVDGFDIQCDESPLTGESEL
ncbi:hypothetical protein FDECE_10056, partial [Fusarium decemcellulare]